MTKPVRIQLRRRKGFDLQAISRALNGLPAINCARPGKLGNMFVVGVDGDAARCCALHRERLVAGGVTGYHCTITLAELKKKISGHNLACFCPKDSPHCHVDAYLEVANVD